MPPNKPSDPVQGLLAAVTKQYGAGSLMQMGDKPLAAWPTVSTGSVGLDVALGIGGLPRGRITEIYGPEGSGKTTLALHAIANVQKAGGLAVMIDAEHALDPEYAARLGVDIPRLLLNQPDTGEQALEITDMCIRSGAVDIIVIDSVAALVPRAEIEGEMGDSHPGLQARLMSQALRKITGAIGSTKTTCIFINQLREKIGVFYGNPEVTTGGKALKFYASVRLDIRKIETLKDGSESVGQKVRIKVVKNKMAPPFKNHETDIIWGRGFSREAELIELGVKYGVVHKGGAYYSFGEGATAQGKEKARQLLEANPGLSEALDKEIRSRMMAAPALTVSSSSPAVADLLGGSAPALSDLARSPVPDIPGGNDPDAQ
jgi:recombination protein RecA